MQLKEGYKQTEIGVLPEDWDTPELGELGSFKNGVNKDKESFGFGFPFVNLMDVFGKPILDERIELELLDSNSLEHELYGLKKGDVLFVRSSVKPSGVGLTCLIPNDLQKTVFSGFLIRYRENQKINLDFKRHCFYEERFRQRIIASSTVSANTNINQEVLKKIRVALPPTKEEQQAIATALSEVDTLITNLNKLITKKKAIKQGAMQQLLKSPAQGGKRLPGFDGEWVETTIGTVAVVQTGSTPPTSDISNYGIDYLFVGPGDLGKGAYIRRTEKMLSKKGFAISRCFPENSILFTCIGSTIGKTGIASRKLTSNQQINAVFPSDSFYYLFAYYLLTYLSPQIKSLAGEQAVPQINKTQFEATLIEIPKFKQQEAIATILSDMDKEIEGLEQKKSKYIRIKQGMMQELLTGKTRLI